MSEPVLNEELKTALVTGASRGIGSAIAVALAGRGWRVVINYLGQREAACQTLEWVEAAGGQGICVRADISIAADRQRLLEAATAAFGRLDLLVNNAGMAPRQRVDLLEVDETSYDEVMATNLKGPFFLTQQVARRMLEQVTDSVGYRPKIVNIGSISAYTSSLNRAEYCLSKAGVGMLTILFADRLAEAGINVYEIRPGIIQTDMTSRVQARYDRLIGEGVTPIKRWGQAEDVARAVMAIAEDLLPFSTGEVINVDGGFHLRRL
jgi:NAD(P)-dependent dehydrogenase (short-subunit alcohol dehydrogenase family)